MFNSISINFTRPWYLLLLILFLGFTIIPYFTLSKRYRKTRNRLTSMALHALVSVFVIFLLSGFTLIIGKPNTSNEIILLVDVSVTEEQSANKRDEFIQTVIEQCKFDKFKIGVVTFGYDQEYAVPLTREYKKIYSDYKNASLPDVSATNVANALVYAKTLLTTDSGKIVLITDGKETDDNAKSVIRAIAATGVTIDTVYIDSSYEGQDDYQIIGVTMPDYHVNKNEECIITVDVYSLFSTNVTLELYDNDVKSSNEEAVEIEPGQQTVSFKHTFTDEGLHELTFKLANQSDLLEANNDFTSYFFLEQYNKILILEQEEGQSSQLVSLMTANNDYVVTVMNVLSDELPKTALDLCEYDEIIFNNIANSDLPEGFIDEVHDYVYNFGGGLLTTGGSNTDGTAHAYDRLDLYNTVYQQMLPVQAINYTPPVGVIIIIDRSGSMGGGSGEEGGTLLEWATSGAVSCLNSLTERDYMGIMTLDSDYSVILELTPATQKNKILSAISSIDTPTGSTVFPGAIDRAGQQLRALKNVDKKHIIIVTDGYVPSSEMEQYESYAKNYYDTDGITISVVGVNMSISAEDRALLSDDITFDDIKDMSASSAYMKMLRICKLTHGKMHPLDGSDNAKLVTEMREDLNAKEIKEVTYETYYPQMVNATSAIFNGVERLQDDEHSNCLTVTLDGYYGVKARASADTLLVGDYNVPVYSQWKFGKGSVGSLMVDIYGEFTSSLLADENGKTLLFNIINSVTPVENIRSNDIRLVLYEDNYSNTLSIFTDLKDGETIQGTISYKDESGEQVISLNSLPTDTSTEVLRNSACYVVTALGEENSYTRSKFIIKKAGAYTIDIKLLDKDGNVKGSNTIYKSFAYSSEYDLLDDSNMDYEARVKSLAQSGNGEMIEDLEDPHEIIDSFKTTLYKSYDLRMLFAILAIACFLLDIAVRKFKFKWPHEIVKKWKDGKKW